MSSIAVTQLIERQLTVETSLGCVRVSYPFNGEADEHFAMESGLNFFDYQNGVLAWAERHRDPMAAEIARIAAEEICKTENCCNCPVVLRERPRPNRLDARLIV